ncbi:MAG TPA: hypothetical protein VFL17_21570 [Anaerolineae bacterium]|nr:hypothetical protein [Anaerolineae bacterium]
MRESRRWRRDAAFASMIVLIAVLALLLPALLQPDGLIYPPQGSFTDLTITHWPAFDYLSASLRQTGALPLWRTSILGGTPFAADPVTGTWYLPNWLSIALPLEAFFKLIFAAHLALGGVAMMFLARSFGVGWIGAAASGVAYGVAPRVVAHMGAGHVTLVEAWPWMPLTVWAYRRGATWKGALFSGVALGFCALADLRAVVYAGVVIAAYALIAGDASRALRVRVLHLLIILSAALFVGAAAWLPALSLAGESTRASLSAGEAGAYSLPFEYLAGVLLAVRGDAERLTYVGLAVLVLALAGLQTLLREQRRAAIWLITLVVIGSIAALGANTPLYDVMVRLPGVSLLRVPGRAWFLVAFAAGLACGLGVDAMVKRKETRLSKPWMLAALLVAWFALLFGLGGALLAYTSGQAGAGRAGLSLIGLAVVLPLAIALVIARASGRLAPSRFGALVVVLIAIDLVWVGWGQYRVVSRNEAFTDGRAVAAYLASETQEALFRVYSPSYSLPQHAAQEYELELADGIDPLQLERTVRFMQRASGVGEWGYSVTLPAFEELTRDEDVRTLLSGVVPDPALLGLLNVRYVVAHFPIAHADLIEIARIDGAYVYKNARVSRHAWVAGRVDMVSNQAQALDWLDSHDMRGEAVVEGGRPLSLGVVGGEARIVARAPDRLVVSARGPGLLVVSEVYERNWRALVDGEAAPIYAVDGVLRGVYLDDGQHLVEFDYDPAAVKLGVLIGGAAIVIWLSIWVITQRRQVA